MEEDFYYKYVGSTYNRLTIKSVLRTPKPKFVCECSCGGEITTDVHSVLHSKTSSCGCLKVEKIRENGKQNIKSDGKVGQKFKNKLGFEYEIVQYVKSNKVLVKFLGTGYEKWSAMKEIQKGSIRDWIATPLTEKQEKAKVSRPRKTAVEVGQIFTNFYGCEYEIVEILPDAKCKIRFLDEFGYEKVILRTQASRGIRNPYRRLVCGVGYVGVGEFSPGDGKSTLYTLWNNMFVRCYDEHQLTKGITYRGCTVDEQWHNFQNFAKWCTEQPQYGREGWYLDKDILCKGNKVYGPETCCFVPVQINNLFTLRGNDRGDFPVGVHFDKKSGRYVAQVNINKKRVCLGRFNTVDEAFKVYKEKKEEVIRMVAHEYKEELNERVFNSLINWKLEVTD